LVWNLSTFHITSFVPVVPEVRAHTSDFTIYKWRN
jgi:hypothetical protein